MFLLPSATHNAVMSYSSKSFRQYMQGKSSDKFFLAECLNFFFTVFFVVFQTKCNGIFLMINIQNPVFLCLTLISMSISRPFIYLKIQMEVNIREVALKKFLNSLLKELVFWKKLALKHCDIALLLISLKMGQI